MLKAARAHGSPMMVIAMITAATSQATAIQMPPVRIQSTFRMMFSGDIGLLPGLSHDRAALPAAR